MGVCALGDGKTRVSAMTRQNEAAAARQIAVTIAFVLLGTLLGALAGFGLIAALGYDLATVQGEGYGSLSSGMLAGVLAANQAFGYLLPGIAASYFLYRGAWLRGVHLDPPPAIGKLAIALIAFAGTLYLTGALAALNASVELAGWQADVEADVAELLDRLINRQGYAGFATAILLIAVLPALGEELVFRGLLQPALIVRVRSAHLGIWITGIVFGAVHMQFAGILPRVFLGVVLGFLAFYSQRLWVPIVAHALFNGAQVAAVRAGALDAETPSSVAPPAVATLLIGLALALVSLYFLLPLIRPDAPPTDAGGESPTLPTA